MARRSDESMDYVGTIGRGKGGDERPAQADGDGRIEKNHLATGHYNNT